MRYLGNKELITHEIFALLSAKNLANKNLTLFDAFCGTGSVSEALKHSFKIAVNDNLNWCVKFTYGRLCANICKFEKLGFDPFEFFNSNASSKKGFMYQNYSPGGSKRMYFTAKNAGRIDFFRGKIEEWKNQSVISDEEYCYLLACLIESVSNVSNTAGVYGAYLKHWDSRALKPIIFSKVDSHNSDCNGVMRYNDFIENIISEVQCDILYLDPPYTQNQYGTQYHLLETLILNDKPNISPITGSRKTAPMRSEWSKDFKAHISFDYVIAKTKAKYILFSYSTDGIMSKDFIEASLKRYGKSESYVCKKISYKKYKNFKTGSHKEHFEYLFFIEKKVSSDVVIESPLNYIGSKSKMIDEIRKHMPAHCSSFIDLFGGGFNVGINADSNQIIYNDINPFVKDLVRSFKVQDTHQYLLFIKKIIRKFDLKEAHSKNYLRAREYYNSLPKNKRDPRLLYSIVLYGFQQQIRFNSQHDFNNPVGMRWFNDRVLEKLVSFSRAIKEKEVEFISLDFRRLADRIGFETFVYMDPPYMLTTGSYNDGKRGFLGWNELLETDLLCFADDLSRLGVKFMISYVLEHRGVTNNSLKHWIKKRGYRTISIEPVKGNDRKEVLIVNYDTRFKLLARDETQRLKKRDPLGQAPLQFI